ncbi:unnamed protein product, partial [Closterium sp. NIES-53]
MVFRAGTSSVGPLRQGPPLVSTCPNCSYCPARTTFLTLPCVRCPTRSALSVALPACCLERDPRSALPYALLARCSALQPGAALPCSPALPCPAARALPCPAAHASLCPASRAMPCPAARTPCSPCAALLAQPCSPCAALPCSPRAALPCSLRAALPCGLRAPLPCSPRAALLPARRPALRPARRPALHLALRPALQPVRSPSLQPARRPTLQPARRPALQPARRPALQPALCPALLPARPAARALPCPRDFAATRRLNYVASLVTKSEFICPPSVGGELALGCDFLEDRHFELECLATVLPRFASMRLCPKADQEALDIPTPRSYAEAITGEYSSWWQTAMDAEIASWKSTGTYIDEVPPPGANIVDGMWIFRVKRPPGSPPAFKACYVAEGFTQRDYELNSHEFSTAFLEGSLHEKIWLRRPPGITGSFPEGTQWSLRRPVYDLRQAPHEWHDTLRTMLAALVLAPSTADPSLFLLTGHTRLLFYILVYVNDLVFATVDTEALTLVKEELQKRHTCINLGELRSYLGLQITRDRARRTITVTDSHMYVGHGARAWRTGFTGTHRTIRRFLGRRPGDLAVVTCCEAEIYAGAMAIQELRWLTYLLADLGERTHSPPVKYIDKKAMIALCQEQRLEHRTKRVALHYFLARELQQRGQLRLAYVATRANTADIFTKALHS